jgi:RNA polymerase sigma factor for flagellar operon FliA
VNPALVLICDEDDEFEVIRLVVETSPLSVPEPVLAPVIPIVSEPVVRRRVESVPTRDELIEEHLSLVTSVVDKLKMRLPSHIDSQELHSVGVHGLIAAAANYNHEQARKFRGYASMRIRGAILDELRRLDPVPRRMRAQMKKIASTTLELEAELGRDPTDSEIAAKMGMTEQKFCRVSQEIKSTAVTVVPLDSHADGDSGEGSALHEFVADDNDVLARDSMEEHETINIMLEHVAGLPAIAQRILRAYYFEHLRLWQIAEEFGLTESRICQIHKSALDALRAKVRLRKDR